MSAILKRRKRAIQAMSDLESAGIAVDVGGTKVGFAAFDGTGAILGRRTIMQVDLDQLNPSVAIAHEALRMADAVGRERVRTASFDAPGNPGSGESFAPNNPNWTFPQSIKDLSMVLPGVNIQAVNDVNAAAFGEYVWGASKARSLIYLNLGTGFAGGAVVDGHLVTGSHGLALELGYLIPTTHAVSKGAASHSAPTEDMLSGGGITAAARYLTDRDIAASEILRQEANADLLVIKERFRAELGNVVCNMAIVFDPDIVVLGGGLASFCEPLLPGVQKKVDEFVPYPVPVRISRFPHDAALLGAVAFGLEALGTKPESVEDKVLAGWSSLVSQ